MLKILFICFVCFLIGGIKGQDGNPTVGDPTIVRTISTMNPVSGTAVNGKCNITLKFTLDKAPPNINDVTVTSASINSIPVLQQYTNSATYTTNVDVKESGDIRDLQVKYKGETLPVTANSAVYSCNKLADNDSSSSSTLYIGLILVATLSLIIATII